MLKLISLVIITVSISAVVALLYWITSVLEYKWGVDERCAEISFDEFLTFYKSAPHKWSLQEDHLEYSRNGVCRLSEDIYFKSYSDYRKYKKWDKRRQENQREQSRNKRLLELTKLWSQDINEHHQSSMDGIFAMYQDNIVLSKRYEENLKRIKQKYKIQDEDIISYSIEPIDGARIIKTKGGSSVRIPMYELLT